MTNVSNRVVAGYFSESNHGEFNYDFDVRDSEGKSAPKTCYMKAEEGLDRGSCPDFITRTHKGIGDDLINPRESIKGSAELSELYDLKPGAYRVQLSWWEHRVRYRDPQKPRPPTGAVVVKSNTITVTITP
jgi:hypothetical protein